MIFATVGTQLAFPRLLDALDIIAVRRGLQIEAQTADPQYESRVMKCRAFLSSRDFSAAMSRCSLVIGHAGTGVIIAAAQHRKPLIIMPRRAALGEHRNEHQLATAERFADAPGISVAHDAAELERMVLAPSDPMAVDWMGQRRQGLIDLVAGLIAR